MNDESMTMLLESRKVLRKIKQRCMKKSFCCHRKKYIEATVECHAT